MKKEIKKKKKKKKKKQEKKRDRKGSIFAKKKRETKFNYSSALFFVNVLCCLFLPVMRVFF